MFKKIKESITKPPLLPENLYTKSDDNYYICSIRVGLLLERNHFTEEELDRAFPVCKKQFETFENLISHLLWSHGINALKSTASFCSHCEVFFRSHAEAKKHNRSECVVNLYQCNLCQCRFGSDRSLANHRRFSHPEYKREQAVRCDVCEKSFSKEVIVRKLKVLSGILKVTYFQSSLMNHVKFHHFPTNTLCEYCDKHFYSNYTKKRHIRRVHGKEGSSLLSSGKEDNKVNKSTVLEDITNTEIKSETNAKIEGSNVKTSKYFVPHLKCQENNCGTVFLTKAALDFHSAVHEDKEKEQIWLQKDMKCQYCRDVLPFNEMKKHVNTFHLGVCVENETNS